MALIGSLTSLVFTLWPSLAPDPRSNLGAEISIFAIDRGVTYGDFVARVSITDPGMRNRLLSPACRQTTDCPLLRLPGEEVYVRTTIRGFKRRSVTMLASLYRTSSDARVPGASDVQVASESLDAPSDSAVVPIWMICPLGAQQSYFVRVEVYHAGDGVLLAVADSRPFRTGCRT